jgi:hypothetical protein
MRIQSAAFTVQPKLRPEVVFQSGTGRTAQSGQVDTTSEPTEQVQLSGRDGGFAPLRSLSGQSLQGTASAAGLAAAGAAGLPAAVLRYFTPAEFLMLNSGDYHNFQHPINVASTVANLASNSGRSLERVEFLEQVALLHDADERIMLDGQGNYSYARGAKPARVPVTLAFIDLNAEALSERFGWSGTELLEAKALIAGTEHPLNDEVTAKRHNNLPQFDGKTAEALLRESLAALPKDRQAVVAEEVQLLRFADQSANYTLGVEASRDTVRGLSNEIGVPSEVLLKGTPSFLAGLGEDSTTFQDFPQATTRKLAAEMGLDASVYSAQVLHSFFAPAERAALETVRAGL